MGKVGGWARDVVLGGLSVALACAAVATLIGVAVVADVARHVRGTRL